MRLTYFNTALLLAPVLAQAAGPHPWRPVPTNLWAVQAFVPPGTNDTRAVQVVPAGIAVPLAGVSVRRADLPRQMRLPSWAPEVRFSPCRQVYQRAPRRGRPDGPPHRPLRRALEGPHRRSQERSKPPFARLPFVLRELNFLPPVAVSRYPLS